MNQMSFMRSAQSEILHQILLLSLLSVILRQWVNSVEKDDIKYGGTDVGFPHSRHRPEVLSTPMNIPSVEQVKLRADTPIGSQQMILLYLELFLVTVLQNDAKPDVFPRRRITGTFVSPVELSGTREKRLQEITEFMEFHICEQLSLDQLCEHFSLSRSSIQKLFQKEKGCGPMEYFNGLKIQRAKDMIRDGRKI